VLATPSTATTNVKTSALPCGISLGHTRSSQIVPFADKELEKLYYYVNFLIQKLTRAESGGAVDLDGAVVLTHLGTTQGRTIRPVTPHGVRWG
jgi:hypothetical protein